MLKSRAVTDLKSLCPAAYVIGEHNAGSGVLCRVTGRIVATGTDPSSLAAYCCAPVPRARGEGRDGSAVEIGYQACVVWRHNRDRELREKSQLAEGAPDRVKEAMAPAFITRA